MAEKLYRKNEDGDFEAVEQEEKTKTVTPEARGKAAARDRWLAQMGGLRKNGTFRNGKMRGKTYDQANQEFEGMWTNAPEALKEGYAQHARSGATKSEVASATGVGPTPKATNASLNATKPGETYAQAQERFRQSRTGVKPAPKPAAVNIGTPEEQARVQAMVNEGSGFATAFYSIDGNYAADVTAANAMAKKTQAQENAIASGSATPEEIAQIQAKDKAEAEKRQASNKEADARNAQATAAAKVEADRRAAGLSSAPITPAVPAPITAQGTPPAGQPVQAVGATPSIAPAPQIVGPPRGAMNAPQITGKPVMGDAPKGVNRLTGLPMGYLPGDDVSGASSQIQQRAGDSVRRQEQAAPIARQTSVAPVLPPRGPASQPERTGSVLSPTPSPRANDPDIIRKDNVARANYQSSFTGGNPDDASFNAAKNGQKKLYDGASEMDKARLVGNSLKNSTAVNNSVPPPARQPVSSRVVAQRPATPEESRTGKVGTPPTVNAPRATVVPGVRPTPPQFNPTNSSRPPSRVMPAQPRKPVLPGLTRPVFAMANR